MIAKTHIREMKRIITAIFTLANFLPETSEIAFFKKKKIKKLLLELEVF